MKYKQFKWLCKISQALDKPMDDKYSEEMFIYQWLTLDITMVKFKYSPNRQYLRNGRFIFELSDNAIYAPQEFYNKINKHIFLNQCVKYIYGKNITYSYTLREEYIERVDEYFTAIYNR